MPAAVSKAARVVGGGLSFASHKARAVAELKYWDKRCTVVSKNTVTD